MRNQYILKLSMCFKCKEMSLRYTFHFDDKGAIVWKTIALFINTYNWSLMQLNTIQLSRWGGENDQCTPG